MGDGYVDVCGWKKNQLYPQDMCFISYISKTTNTHTLKLFKRGWFLGVPQTNLNLLTFNLILLHLIEHVSLLPIVAETEDPMCPCPVQMLNKWICVGTSWAPAPEGTRHQMGGILDLWIFSKPLW